MEYIYTALLLHKLQKEINEDNIKKVLQAAGAEPEDVRIKALVAALSEVNIDEALKSAVVAQTTATPVAVAAKQGKEEKKEVKDEKQEEEALAGLSSLFG